MSRSLGGTSFTTLPPISISPPEISSRPAIMRSSVDLPHPEGPTSTANSPSAMSIDTPRITCVPPKYFWTLRMWTAAMRSGPGLRRGGSFDDDVRGTARLRPVDQVLGRLAPQLLFAFRRVEGGMGRE